MIHYKYLFIGGGIASISAVTSLRSGCQDEIAIINNEPYLPYKRTQLSKKLTGNDISNDFKLLDTDWYVQNNIQIIYDEVVSINPTQNLTLLLDGREIYYDYLIIATGLHANVPLILGIPPHEINVLRTINQANAIIQLAKKSKTVLIIGGGVEGIEIASQMSILGKQVTIIDKNNHLMHRNLSPQNSICLQEQIESCGVAVLTNTTIKSGAKLTNESYLVTTNSGTCQADIIIAAVGALPNSKLAEMCGIEVSLGIEVNEYLQTSIPNIYAIGDVVNIPSHKNHHLWHQAEHMGQCVAKNLLGQHTIYEHKLFRLKAEVFNTYIFSLNTEIQRNPKCETVTETKGTKTRNLYFVNDQLQGLEMLNDGENAKLYQQAVWEKWSYQDVKRKILLEE